MATPNFPRFMQGLHVLATIVAVGGLYYSALDTLRIRDSMGSKAKEAIVAADRAGVSADRAEAALGRDVVVSLDRAELAADRAELAADRAELAADRAAVEAKRAESLTLPLRKS